MHSTDLLTNHDVQRGLWTAFIALSQSVASGIRAGAPLAVASRGIVAFCVLFGVVRSIVSGGLDVAAGTKAARRFSSRLERAAGLVIIVAIVGAAFLTQMIGRR